VFLIGMLVMLASAGAGTALAWDNRNAMVHVQIGRYVWTGHLYGVLAAGALLTCWFLLGLSCVRCRVAELRAARRAARERNAATGPSARSRPRSRRVTAA
jgi:hypothetical protein